MESPLKLRKATFNDWEILLKWRNDIETRKSSHNIEMVKEKGHKEWFKNSLENKNRQIYIAIEGSQPVGTVRSDCDKDIYLLSWSVSPDARGRGIGKLMVKMLVNQLNANIRAEIKEDKLPAMAPGEISSPALIK